MLRKVTILIIVISLYVFAQSPYLPGEIVLPEHNLSWTDNNAYSTNIFDEIAVNQKVVVIFWGSDG